MGMETTWDEIRIAALQKMMVIEGNTVENNDSTAYFLAAMPAAYNEAVRLLSTTNRYITKVYEQPADGLTQTMMIDLQKAIPDLFQLKANGIYFTDLHGKTISYYGQSMQLCISVKGNVGYGGEYGSADRSGCGQSDPIIHRQSAV